MDDLVITTTNNLPAEAAEEPMPVPADGKVLYITPETKEFDFRALLGQALQCVNMGEILAEIKAGTQYVVQIPAEFQAAYESARCSSCRTRRAEKCGPR